MQPHALHHAGSFAIWSTEEARPLSTGTDRAEALERLRRLGAEDPEAILDLAETYGSSIPQENGAPLSASHAMEGNSAGSFGEEVPVEDIFNHLLRDRKAI